MVQRYRIEAKIVMRFGCGTGVGVNVNPRAVGRAGGSFCGIPLFAVNYEVGMAELSLLWVQVLKRQRIITLITQDSASGLRGFYGVGRWIHDSGLMVSVPSRIAKKSTSPRMEFSSPESPITSPLRKTFPRVT